MPLDILARADLTATAKLVYVAISDRIGTNGEAWPGVRKLAADCSVRPATVCNAIARLESAGLLVVERTVHTTNHYRLARVTETVTDGVLRKPKQPVTKTVTACYENRNGTVTKTVTKPEKRQEPETITREAPARKPSSDPLAIFDNARTCEVLNTDRFREAWGRWTTYRREIGKTLKPSTIQAQVRKLEKFGHDAAVAAIDASIEQGWIGLFERSGNDSNTTNPARLVSKPGKYAGIARKVSSTPVASGERPTRGVCPAASGDSAVDG